MILHSSERIHTFSTSFPRLSSRFHPLLMSLWFFSFSGTRNPAVKTLALLKPFNRMYSLCMYFFRILNKHNIYIKIHFENWLLVETAHCHCSPIHWKYSDTPMSMTWTIHYSACCRRLTKCKQLVTACHQWNNNDVLTFPKRIMPECQACGYINKTGKGASKRKSIFQMPQNTLRNASGKPLKEDTWIRASTSSPGQFRGQKCSVIA